MKIIVLCFLFLILALSTRGEVGAAEQTLENWPLIGQSVPNQQREILEGDLFFLQNISDRDLSMMKVANFLQLPLKDLAGEELTRWLKERVHYVIGEDEDYLKQTSPYVYSRGESPFIFPQPSLDPYALLEGEEGPSPSSPEKKGETKIMVSMANRGSELYLISKFELQTPSQYHFVGEDGEGQNILINSPRVGIIQIGEGFFRPLVREMPRDSLLDRWNRITTLFHEARHSDGHGESLTFSHIQCPDGHPYQGYFCCDRALNGSYAVELSLLESFQNGALAEGLSEKEQSLLQLLHDDIGSRIITEGKKVVLDPQIKIQIEAKKEQIAELEDRLARSNENAVMRALMRRIERLEKEIRLLEKDPRNRFEIVNSKNWDEQPEVIIREKR